MQDKIEMLHYALGMAQNGHPIFPVGTDKKPLTKNGFYDASSDPEQVREWWSKWPSAGIGMPTGPTSGVWALDIDLPHGPETLAKLEAEHTPLPATLSQQTGGGGEQKLFQWDGKKIKNSTQKIGPGVDVRGEGGYVVIPPSLHISGKRYKWTDRSAPVVAPPWLVELALQKRTPPPRPKKRSAVLSIAGSPYGLAALSAERQAVATALEGERNDTLNRASFAGGQLLAGGELRDRAEVESELLQAAVDAGLEPSAAARTIQSGLCAGMEQPRSAPEAQCSLGRAVPTTNGQDMERIRVALGRGQQGDAELFRDLYQGRFLCDHSVGATGTWHEWQGHHWSLETVGEPCAAVDAVIALYEQARAETQAAVSDLSTALSTALRRGLPKEMSDDLTRQVKAQESLLREITTKTKKLQTLAYRRQVVEFSAQGARSLGISGDEWDRHPTMLPCSNGVVDMETGNLCPGAPDQFIRTATPHPYDPDADCPLFRQFLLDIFSGDQEMVEYIQRVCGYGASGLTLEHFLPVLFGERGRNGKGTLLETLAHVLGPLAGPAQAELLLDQGRTRSSAGPSSDIMALRGRRLAWASETGQGRKLAAAKVKMLTGGDSLVGRPPYGRREVSFRPTHILFLLTNYRPHCDSDDHALWSRIHLIEFSRSYVPNPSQPWELPADLTLPERLRSESSGILRWLVDGFRAWRKHGLRPPDKVRAATMEYRRDEDVVQTFIEERCMTGHQVEVKASAIYTEYRKWCDDLTIRPITGRKFWRKLSENFSKDERVNGNYYLGIGIRCAD